MNYTVCTGGKDEFISRGHAGRYNDVILFVDDKATTLRAVCEPYPWTMGPRPCGIEMCPWNKGFQTPSGDRYKHCATLDELLKLIIAWSRNGGKLSFSEKSTKRRSDNETEEAQPARKSHKGESPHTAEMPNDASRDKEAMLASHLATLRLTSRNPSHDEVFRAFDQVMTEQSSEESERRVQRAFQFVWNKINKYPEPL